MMKASTMTLAALTLSLVVFTGCPEPTVKTVDINWCHVESKEVNRRLRYQCGYEAEQRATLARDIIDLFAASSRLLVAANRRLQPKSTDELFAMAAIADYKLLTVLEKRLEPDVYNGYLRAIYRMANTVYRQNITDLDTYPTQIFDAWAKELKYQVTSY